MQGSQHASIQTDPQPTKLMRDVAIDQKGLIILKDQGILTDGNVMIRTEAGKFILTNSVSSSTDLPLKEDAATQTALPRSEVDFMEFIDPDVDAIRAEIDEMCQKRAVSREKQKTEVTELLKQLKSYQGTQDYPSLESTQEEGLYSVDSLNQTSMIPVPSEISIEICEPKMPRRSDVNTYAHWTNLDFDNDEKPPSLPRRTLTEGEAPWRNFKDLILGNRLMKMDLPPVTTVPPEKPRQRTITAPKKSVTWSDTQKQVVNDLIHEASNLINVFDKLSILLGPNIGNLGKIPSIEALKAEKSISKYREIGKQNCLELEEALKNFQPIHFPPAEDLPPHLKQYAKRIPQKIEQ